MLASGNYNMLQDLQDLQTQMGVLHTHWQRYTIHHQCIQTDLKIAFFTNNTLENLLRPKKKYTLRQILIIRNVQTYLPRLQ